MHWGFMSRNRKLYSWTTSTVHNQVRVVATRVRAAAAPKVWSGRHEASCRYVVETAGLTCSRELWSVRTGGVRCTGEVCGPGDEDVSELWEELLMLHMLDRCDEPRGDPDLDPGGVWQHTAPKYWSCFRYAVLLYRNCTKINFDHVLNS